MGREHRVSNIKRNLQYLKIIFVLSALLFIYTFSTLPKTDCQVCKFEELGMNAKEFSNAYGNACLKDAYEEKETFYVDIDDINITEDSQGIQNLTFKS